MSAERIKSAWRDEGAAISSVNLGEVLYIGIRGSDEESAISTVETIRRRLTVVEPDWEMTVAAAKIKAKGGLAYADSFCISTAVHLGAPIWTGDPEIVEQAAIHEVDVVDLRNST